MRIPNWSFLASSPRRNFLALLVVWALGAERAQAGFLGQEISADLELWNLTCTNSATDRFSVGSGSTMTVGTGVDFAVEGIWVGGDHFVDVELDVTDDGFRLRVTPTGDLQFGGALHKFRITLSGFEGTITGVSGGVANLSDPHATTLDLETSHTNNSITVEFDPCSRFAPPGVEWVEYEYSIDAVELPDSGCIDFENGPEGPVASGDRILTTYEPVGVRFTVANPRFRLFVSASDSKPASFGSGSNGVSLSTSPSNPGGPISEDSHGLIRATFSIPVCTVSIDALPNGTRQAAVLRAYNRSGLVDEDTLSNVTGGTLTVTGKPISYVEFSGLGDSRAFFDNLKYHCEPVLPAVNRWVAYDANGDGAMNMADCVS
ncbi:MAG: hypothetical protein AAF488_15370, partial [Planctomycetota bacterium]